MRLLSIELRVRVNSWFDFVASCSSRPNLKSPSILKALDLLKKRHLSTNSNLSLFYFYFFCRFRSSPQNIGTMLKTHFSASQFIVVSLKEGMFNNANVIFRTKFVDGISTVGRTVNRAGTTTARPGRSDATAAAAGGGGKARKRGKTSAEGGENQSGEAIA